MTTPGWTLVLTADAKLAARAATIAAYDEAAGATAPQFAALAVRLLAAVMAERPTAPNPPASPAAT